MTELEQELKEAVIYRLETIEQKIKQLETEKKDLERRYQLLADYMCKEGEDMNCPKCGKDTERLIRGRCEECRDEERKEKQREEYATHKKPQAEPKAIIKPEKIKSIDEFQKEALEHGMTYGQWQALQTIRRQKETG